MDSVFSRLKGDRWLWIIIIILSVWSLLAVYSSVGTLAYKEGKGTEVYLIKHTLLIVGGFALMYFSHKLDYQWYAGISKILMAITIPLLLYTLFFGNTVNEASRWVTIPVINQTDHFSGPHADAQTGEYQRRQKGLHPHHGFGLYYFCTDRTGQSLHRPDAVRGERFAADRGQDQYQADFLCVYGCIHHPAVRDLPGAPSPDLYLPGADLYGLAGRNIGRSGR